MFSRLIIATFSVFLLAGCDDTPKDTSEKEGVSICKGLDEAQCTANNECVWKADKAKCTKKESDETSPQQSSPQPESGTPEATPQPKPDTPQ